MSPVKDNYNRLTNAAQLKIFTRLGAKASTEIFELRYTCPNAIIVSTEDYYMSSQAEYILQLENLITNQLLPVHQKYYALLGEQEPDLGLSYVFKLRNKMPALFKPKNKTLVNADQN